MLTEKLSTSISMLSPSVRRSMPVYRLRPSRATFSSTFTRLSTNCAKCSGVRNMRSSPGDETSSEYAPGKRIVGIEQIRHRVARFAAVIDIDPFGMVDIDAQRSAARPGHELDFDEFVSDFFQNRLKQGDETVMQCRIHSPLQQKRAPKALQNTRRHINGAAPKKQKPHRGLQLHSGHSRAKSPYPNEGADCTARNRLLTDQR